jgi:uncharacterized iron-regulated protein
VAIALLLAFGGCTRGSGWYHDLGLENPLVGTILEVATGRRLGENELVERLQDHAFVLVGETSGNRDQARLTGRLVTELGSGGRRLAALALESLPTDTQPMVVEYQAAHPGDARGLDRLVQAAAPDRPHLPQYTPAITAAVAQGAQIVAADLSANTLRLVMTQGIKALQPAFVRRTGLNESFATPIQESLRGELIAAACGLANERATDALVRARRARDATMADRLAAVTGRGQSVLVAALPHVRLDRGVPWYLRQLRPAALMASVAFVELADADAEPTDLPYDYVWFTPAPRPKRVSGCARLPASGGSRDGAPAFPAPPDATPAALRPPIPAHGHGSSMDIPLPAPAGAVPPWRARES